MVKVLKSVGAIENLARGLTVCSFVLLCWLLHRAVQPRPQCVNSAMLRVVHIDGRRMDNCLFESRITFKHNLDPVPEDSLRTVRLLESFTELDRVFPAAAPFLTLEISSTEPRAFEAGRGYLRLGQDWLSDRQQTERALMMAIVKTRFPGRYQTQFQIEMITDFLLMSAGSDEQWLDESTGKSYSLLSDAKFPTTPVSFAEYCRSPFRSLAHRSVCNVSETAQEDRQADAWGVRPLLSAALWRVFDKLPLKEKLRVTEKVRAGVDWPQLTELPDKSGAGLVLWFQSTLSEHLLALGVPQSEDTKWAVKRTMKELEVEAPTHWELTVDLKNTPAWKEIVSQLRERSKYRGNERTLIFTPAGAVALPSGLPVSWNTPDIQSQKHVMIACHWPKTRSVASVSARHFFAHQSCGKLTEVFWD